MKVPLYQIDAFTGRLFAGNPAGVCPLESWLADATMQAIAAENALSETAFLVEQGEGYGLRWFTPACEVDLCGHATLASAFVLFEELGVEAERIVFSTRSGALSVAREGALLAMDFPALPPEPREDQGDAVAAALGARPSAVLGKANLMAVFADEAAVRALAPDMARIAALPLGGLIVTAPGEGVDFVSRYFAPKAGIPEDPVTGSAHCELAPYWAGRLGKRRLAARQVSTRGGELECEARGDRVVVAGRAVKYLEGLIQL